MVESLVVIGVLVIAIPITIFLGAKLGRFGYLMGEKRFREHQHTGDNNAPAEQA